MSNAVAEMTNAEKQNQLIRVRHLSDDLKWILGRPNFACGGIARLLRYGGMQIEERAEAEQAAVIHWMLCAFMEHGEAFRDVLERELDAIKRNVGVSKG